MIDATEFVATALAQRGALTETGPAGIDVVLPADLAAQLGLEDSFRLHAAVGGQAHGAIGCGLGTPLLDRCIGWARESTPVACARVRGVPARTAQARTAAERFPLRNAVATVSDVLASEGTYLRVWLAWTVEADDRWEGVRCLLVDAVEGNEPDEGLARTLDYADLVDLPGVPHVGPGVANVISARAAAITDDVLAPIRPAVVRRHARDHARIGQYFDELAAETRKAGRRSSSSAAAGAAAVDAKLAHLTAERDAKLADLRERMRLRVSWRLVGACCFVVPRATARLRMRRRKAEREICLHFPPGASSPDRLLCEGCATHVTAAPAVCDEALHVLCEHCVPAPRGRVDCPACARER